METQPVGAATGSKHGGSTSRTNSSVVVKQTVRVVETNPGRA